jgi:hypothetical protein
VFTRPGPWVGCLRGVISFSYQVWRGRVVLKVLMMKGLRDRKDEETYE